MDEDLTQEKHLMLLSLKLHMQWKIMWVWYFTSGKIAFPIWSEGMSQVKYCLVLLSSYFHAHVFAGIQTGECVPYNGSIKTCEVFAWCPVEDDYHIPK